MIYKYERGIIISLLMFVVWKLMRYIGLEDVNGTMIFEGDTLEIIKSEDMNFKKDFLKFFKIDKLTIKVLELDKNEIGVNIKFYYSSNGKNILFSDVIEYFKNNGLNEKEISKIQNNNNSPFFEEYSSLNNSYCFYHNFIHRSSKKIISKKYKGERKLDNEINLADKLKISVLNKRYNAFNTNFLVKLNEDTKKLIKDFITKQDEEYSNEGMIRKGDFTHILLKPNKTSLYEYDFNVSPVNSNLEYTWIESFLSSEKYFKISKELKSNLIKKLDKWKEDNIHLGEEFVSKKSKEMWEKEIESIKRLRFSEDIREEEPCTSIFLGSSGKSLIDYFIDNKCEIIPLEK